MEKILEILGVAGPALTGVVFGGAVLALFSAGDSAISQQAREALSNWLQRLESPDTPPNWPDNFIAMFDRIFGDITRPRAVLMSCLASFAGVILMLMIWGAFRPADFTAFVQGPDWFLTVFGLVLSINLGVDYVSLVETRIVLERIRRAQSSVRIAGWLAFDVVATPVIFFIAPAFILLPSAIGLPSFLLWEPPYEPTADWYLELLVDSWTLRPDSQTSFSYGVLLYTTFFTSFWIWIYVASRALVRGLTASGPALRFLQWVLPIRSKPIRSIGEVAAVLCCVGYWIFAWLAGADPIAVTPPPPAP